MNGSDDVLAAGLPPDDDDPRGSGRGRPWLPRRLPPARWLVVAAAAVALTAAAVVVITQGRNSADAKRDATAKTIDRAIVAVLTAQQQRPVRDRAMNTALIQLIGLATPEDPGSYHQAAASLIQQQGEWLRSTAADLQQIATNAPDPGVRAAADALAGAFTDEAGDLDVTAGSVKGLRTPDTTLSGNVTTELQAANDIVQRVVARTGTRVPPGPTSAPLPVVPRQLLEAMTNQFDASLVTDRWVMASGDYGALWVNPVTGETVPDPGHLVRDAFRSGNAVVGDIMLGAQQTGAGVLALPAGQPGHVVTKVGQVAGPGPRPATAWVARQEYFRPDVVLFGLDGEQLGAPMPLGGRTVTGYGVDGKIVVSETTGCPEGSSQFALWDPATGKTVRRLSRTCGGAVIGAASGHLVWLSDRPEAPVLHVTDIATGDDLAVPVPKDTTVRGALSPDGRHVAVLAGKPAVNSVREARVIMVDTGTGAVSQTGTIDTVLGEVAWSSDSRVLYLQTADRPTGRARLAVVPASLGPLHVVLAKHALPYATLASTPGRLSGGSLVAVP